MSLRTTLGLSRESSLEEGTPDEVRAKKSAALAAVLKPARLEVARRNSKWTEFEEVDLVARGPRNQWFVSATTDEVFEPHRGAVFQSGSTSVIADQADLAFYLDPNGELVFLERIPGTWTEHLEKQAARERAKAAPEPRRVLAE
jgi:hypothetical protein